MIAYYKRRIKWILGLPESPMPVYYWAKLIGLAPFTLKNNKCYPATFSAKLYSTIFIVVELLATSKVIFDHLKFATNTNSPSVMTKVPITGVAVLVVHAVPCCISIIFLTIGNKIVDFLNELCITCSDEMKRLEVVEDCGNVFKKIFATTLTANILVVTTIISANSLDNSVSLFASILYLIKVLIDLNAVLIFTQILIFIRQRFALVNEKLCDGIEPPDPKPESYDNFGETSISSMRKNHLGDNQPGSETLPNIERIETVGALHSKLSDLVDKTTELFSGTILLTIIQCGCRLVLYFYLIYSRMLVLAQIEDEEHTMFLKRKIFGILLMTSVAIGQLFFVAHVSATTCRQGNAAKMMLFKVWNTFPLPELKNEFGMISLQMLQMPVTVSAFGFFDLGYSCPCKILGTVIAYLIVIIQFDITRPNHHIT